MKPEENTTENTTRSFNNPRREPADKKEMICGICKKETRALRQCRDCKLVFCPLCLTKEYNTQGQVTKVYPECPRCRSENIRAC